MLVGTVLPSYVSRFVHEYFSAIKYVFFPLLYVHLLCQLWLKDITPPWNCAQDTKFVCTAQCLVANALCRPYLVPTISLVCIAVQDILSIHRCNHISKTSEELVVAILIIQTFTRYSNPYIGFYRSLREFSVRIIVAEVFYWNVVEAVSTLHLISISRFRF